MALVMFVRIVLALVRLLRLSLDWHVVGAAVAGAGAGVGARAVAGVGLGVTLRELKFFMA